MKKKFTNWLTDIERWDRDEFIEEITEYMVQVNQTEMDRHAIALLAESIDTFVICTKSIREEGLVVVHKNGVTGKNHHVEIRDKAVSRAMQIMTELCLTPKRRRRVTAKGDKKLDKLLAGPLG